jgi:hypothetical protein
MTHSALSLLIAIAQFQSAAALTLVAALLYVPLLSPPVNQLECAPVSGCAQTLPTPQTCGRLTCPPLCVVSMLSCNERNPIVRFSNSSTRAIKSLSDRPKRSSRQTTIVSPFLANSRASFNPGRSLWHYSSCQRRFFRTLRLAERRAAKPDFGRQSRPVRTQ